nr:hypothetical protein [Chromobacterium vaccinii]
MTSQVRLSVSRARGTAFSTISIATISVGAKDSPDSSITAASQKTFGASEMKTELAAVAAQQHNNSLPSGSAGLSAPKASPPMPEPRAYSASTQPAADGEPCALAKATAATSMMPAMAPSVPISRARTGTGGRKSAERPLPGAAGWAGGSVAFWRSRAKTLNRISSAAVSGPASGNQAMHRPIDSGGPITKAISLSTLSSANAVGSSVWPSSSFAQRARVIAGMLGRQPAGAAHRYSVQCGASRRLHRTSASRARAPMPVAGGSTRLWP